MSNTSMVTRGDIERQGFDGRSVERRAETSATAAAARARAEIEARYVMALQRPRDWDIVRSKLLKECERPSFAERAYYSIPRKGAKPGRLTGTPGMVEGLSVRFAEAAIRISGNVAQTTRITYEDDEKRCLNVSAIDLESNSGFERDLVLYKTKERSRVRDGEEVLGERLNSVGQKVFLVAASEEDLLVKESALVSRIFRTEGLRLVPADILEEAETRIIATVRNEDAKDPTAARKRVIDAFAALGVPVDELKRYVGHDLEAFTPAEQTALRGLHAAIKAGEVTWSAALAEQLGESAKEGKKTVQQKIEERAARRQQGEASPATTKTEPAPPPAESVKGDEPIGDLAFAIGAATTPLELRAVVGRTTDALRAGTLTKEQAAAYYELADRRLVELDERADGQKGDAR